MKKRINGTLKIDVYGHKSEVTGWATHCTCFSEAMRGFVHVNYCADSRSETGKSLCKRLLRLMGRKNVSGDFGVVISGKASYPQTTACWNVWETTRLPVSQKELCQSVNYIWTPSSWGRQNLIGNSIKPETISVVPLGVDIDFYAPDQKQSSNFKFLMVGKWEERKFQDGLIKAFTDEFHPKEDVELILHAHNPYIQGFSMKKKLEDLGILNNNNIILSEKCNQISLRELYRSANCFVLPTRAEGWGLPILESMACGIPAIVTRYSAPLDYVTDDNGYLLNVERMVDAHDDVFDIHSGQWAEPDIRHLRFLMRRAFENRGEVLEKGRIAHEDAKRFSWRNSAQIAYQTIVKCLGDSRGGGTY
ncbi:MAG: glycosyltransferase [Geobacteraceae bacterium]|nr:glycosyltransferase [Geobacteraceae bacterium]